MAVSVATPGLLSPRQQQKDDPLDQVLKGLQVVGTVFDIKNSIDKASSLKAESAMKKESFEADKIAKARADQGILSEGQFKSGLLAGDFVPADSETGLPVEVGPGGIAEGPAQQRFVKTKSMIDSEKLAANEEAKAVEKAREIAAKKSDTEFNRVEKLASQHRQASKDSFNSLLGLKKLEAAAETQNPSGATDVSLVFGFMKSIDPTSTVREGEFATAEQAGGVDDRILNTYNKLLRGERLTPQQRSDFLRAGRESVFKQLETQIETDNTFSRLAKSGGVDPDLVVDPRFNQSFEALREKLGNRNKQQSFSSFDTSLPGESTAKASKSPDDELLDKFLGE